MGWFVKTKGLPLGAWYARACRIRQSLPHFLGSVLDPKLFDISRGLRNHFDRHPRPAVPYSEKYIDPSLSLIPPAMHHRVIAIPKPGPHSRHAVFPR